MCVSVRRVFQNLIIYIGLGLPNIKTHTLVHLNIKNFSVRRNKVLFKLLYYLSVSELIQNYTVMITFKRLIPFSLHQHVRDICKIPKTSLAMRVVRREERMHFKLKYDLMPFAFVESECQKVTKKRATY